MTMKDSIVSEGDYSEPERNYSLDKTAEMCTFQTDSDPKRFVRSSHHHDTQSFGNKVLFNYEKFSQEQDSILRSLISSQRQVVDHFSPNKGRNIRIRPNSSMSSQKVWDRRGATGGALGARCLSSERYCMEHPRRGTAVIFNIGKFRPGRGKSDRKGYEVDGALMKATLKSMDFDVVYKENLTRSECINTLRSVALADHSDADCLVLVVMSHGNHDHGDYVTTTDRSLYVDEITSFFTPDMCPSLAGKPKLILIQACRGDDLDEGWSPPLLGYEDEPDTNGSMGRIPLSSDFLLAYSTVPGFASFRSELKGSVWISYLSEVLLLHNRPDCSHDIFHLLTQVNRRVAHKFDTGRVTGHPELSYKKQMPTFTSTLTKDMVLAQKVIRHDTLL